MNKKMDKVLCRITTTLLLLLTIMIGVYGEYTIATIFHMTFDGLTWAEYNRNFILSHPMLFGAEIALVICVLAYAVFKVGESYDAYLDEESE